MTYSVEIKITNNETGQVWLAQVWDLTREDLENLSIPAGAILSSAATVGT